MFFFSLVIDKCVFNLNLNAAEIRKATSEPGGEFLTFQSVMTYFEYLKLQRFANFNI